MIEVEAKIIKNQKWLLFTLYFIYIYIFYIWDYVNLHLNVITPRINNFYNLFEYY